MEKIYIPNQEVKPAEKSGPKGEYTITTFLFRKEKDGKDLEARVFFDGAARVKELMGTNEPVEVDECEEKTGPYGGWFKVRLPKKQKTAFVRGGISGFKYNGPAYTDLSYPQYVQVLKTVFDDSYQIITSIAQELKEAGNEPSGDTILEAVEKVAVHVCMGMKLNCKLPFPAETKPVANAETPFESAAKRFKELVDSSAKRGEFDEFLDKVRKSEKLLPEQKNEIQLAVSRHINKGV